MENIENKNNIFKYLLVVFFAAFIGTGIFLIMSNKTKIPKEKISTARVDFPEENDNVSMTLETNLPGNQVKVGDIVELNLFADSNGKNIVGYDVVMYYDSLAFDFKKGLSSLADYNIFTYKKGHYFTITGLKKLQSVPSPMTKVNKLATLTFEATKAGKFEFSLKQSNEKDKTDLVTDKTEVLIPSLNKIVVNVN